MLSGLNKYRKMLLKGHSVVEMENVVSKTMEDYAPRAMAVLRPLKVVIENYPEGEEELLALAIETLLHLQYGIAEALVVKGAGDLAPVVQVTLDFPIVVGVVHVG